MFFEVSLFNIFSFGIEKDLYIWGINNYQTIEKHNDLIAFYRSGYLENGKKDIFYELKRIEDFSLNNNGWYESSIFGNKHTIIFGGDFFIYYDYINPEFSFYDPDADKKNNKWLQETVINNKIFYCGDRLKLLKNIIFPDILKEVINGKEVIYDSKDMEHFFVHLSDEYITFFTDALPWASSKDPNNFEIYMDFYEPIQSITILNGYVNPTNQSLYKKNRRLKTIKVINNDKNTDYFEITILFEDIVHFEEIKFPIDSSSVKIQIIDFYEGSKYKDLCIQYIGTQMGLNFYNTNPELNNGIFDYEKNKYSKWNGEKLKNK